MKQSSQNRQSNIELLRCLLAIMVITIHFNWDGIGSALYLSVGNKPSYFFAWGLQCFSICAVDCFLLISGYFSIQNREIKIGKIVKVLLMVATCNLITYLMYCIFSGFGTTFSIKTLITQCIPQNYFVTLYCAVILLSPFVNVMVSNLSKKQYLILLGILGGLFSLWEYLYDFAQYILGIELVGMSPTSKVGGEEGYTILIFLFMYLIGGYIRKYGLPKRVTKTVCAISFLIVWLVMTALASPKWGILLFQYNSPFVILLAISLFCFFSKLQMKPHKWVNVLAAGTLSVFLLHVKPIITETLWKGVFHVNDRIGNTFGETIVIFLGTIAATYAICVTVAILLNVTIFKLLDKVCNRLPWKISLLEKEKDE